MLNTLIIKELRNELRTKETFFSMMTLGIVLIFLFSISSSNINTKQSIAFFLDNNIYNIQFWALSLLSD